MVRNLTPAGDPGSQQVESGESESEIEIEIEIE